MCPEPVYFWAPTPRCGIGACRGGFSARCGRETAFSQCARSSVALCPSKVANFCLLCLGLACVTVVISSMFIAVGCPCVS